MKLNNFRGELTDISAKKEPLTSMCSIVVGGRPFVIAGGPLNMCIVVYIHSVYTCYVRYVYLLYIQPPAKGKQAKNYCQQLLCLGTQTFREPASEGVKMINVNVQVPK